MQCTVARLLLTGLEARGDNPYGNPAFVNDLLEKRLGRKTGKRPQGGG
jgi:hypothetical protein